MQLHKLLAVIAVSFTSTFMSASKKPLVSVGYSLITEKATQNGPIVLALTLSSSVPVDIDLGNNRTGALSFDIKSPRSFEKVQFVEESNFRPLDSFLLEPGHPYNQTIVLSKNYFSQPGQYSLSLAIDTTSAVTFIYKHTAGIRLEIASYDPANMAKTCEELSKDLANAPSSEQRLMLAKALASISDSVVLPFLDEELDHGWGTDFEIIQGIEGVGTLPALDVLAKASQNKDLSIRNFVQSALSRLAESSKDPAVRDRAAALLKGNTHIDAR